MSKAYWQVIVPPIVETEFTGRLGACERMYRGHKWTVDVYRDGAVAVHLDGFTIPSAALPAHAHAFAIKARDFWLKAAALRA